MRHGMTKRTQTALLILGFLATMAFAGGAMAAKAPPAAPVDLNKASVQELMTIPGVGQTKAQAIVAYRQATPFASTDELVNVKGIGDKMLARIASYVTVSGSNAKGQPGTAEKAAR